MKNFWKKCTAFAITAAMLLMTGCSGQKGGFVTVDGKSFSEDELYANIYYAIGTSYLGIMEYDETANKSEIKKAIDELEKQEEYKSYIQKQKVAFVKQKVCDVRLLNIANEFGVTLSDDEKSRVDNEYNTIVDFFNSEDTLTQIKEQFYSEVSNADSKAKTYLNDYKRFYLSLYGVGSIEELKDKFNELAIINKVLENKANEVPDDEEYVKNYYSKLLEEQKNTYTADISAFEDDYDYGSVICYYPSGTRYVRHILIEYDTANQETLMEYETQIAELESKESLTDEETATLNDLKSKVSTLTADMEAAALKSANEVYDKIKGGMDYEEALRTYGKDASMTDESSQYAKKGYLISSGSNMVEEFLTAALALKNPGDITTPVKSSYGYHIIKYMEKGREGEVPYSEVRDALLTVAMNEKRNEATLAYYDSVYDDAMANGRVTVDYKALGMDMETYNSLYAEMMSAENNEATDTNVAE